jgi:hypothetical protein
MARHCRTGVDDPGPLETARNDPALPSSLTVDPHLRSHERAYGKQGVTGRSRTPGAYHFPPTGWQRRMEALTVSKVDDGESPTTIPAFPQEAGLRHGGIFPSTHFPAITSFPFTE